MEQQLTIDQIIKDIRSSLVVDKDNDLYNSVALGGEVGEYLNYIKKENRIGGSRFKYRLEAQDELMDIVYYTFLNIDSRKIDVNMAWHRKMSHNEVKYRRPIQDRPHVCSCMDCKMRLGIV